MCGISGKIYFDPQRPVDRALLTAINQTIHHRGPDEDGFHLVGNCGLGHKRLSIIDLSAGQQPIYNELGDTCIVFNGEIYNYRELRERLLARGHVFKTHSDTETILHLYEERGERCVEDLRGMFAFAIWNAREQELLLARDRAGKKPLYYTLADGGITFASELKGLLADPAVERKLNLAALNDYLALQYVPAPETIFEGIHKLPPAHTLRVRRGEVFAPRCYWQLAYEPKLEIDEDEACERVRIALDEAVRIRLEAEVPLGCLLSGGIDSSAVVAYMRKYTAGPLRTFSIGFKEQSHNELPYARTIAKKFGTVHEELIVEPDAISVLSAIVWHCDEPFADSSALPTYYVAQITRRRVTVALNGDGGDESFAGYPRYNDLAIVQRFRRLPRAVRAGLVRPLAAALAKMRPGSPLGEKLTFLNDFSLMPDEENYAQYLTIFRRDHLRKLYAVALRESIQGRNGARTMQDAYLRADLREDIDRRLNTDVQTYLPGDLLVKMDRMAMAHALEGRSPFLDHKLMELAASLPARLKFKGGVQKYLLKKALEPVLPHEILYRKKQGFGVPVADWFRGGLKDYLRDTLTSDRARARGWFEPAAIERLIAQHTAGQFDHYHRLWSLLCLELWAQTFLDRTDVSAPLG